MPKLKTYYDYYKKTQIEFNRNTYKVATLAFFVLDFSILLIFRNKSHFSMISKNFIKCQFTLTLIQFSTVLNLFH